MKMQQKKNLEINPIKRQKITEGSILEINIEKQYFVYAQILNKGGYVFFNYKTREKLIDLSLLKKAPILFVIGVYNDVITKGHWLKVGKIEIRDDLKIQPMQFIQDVQNQGNFELYNPNTGEIRKATKEQCFGLECAAVWEANHVEDRIRDYYDSKPNIWVEQLKIK